jgi:HlyD family secretion protein
MKWWKIAVGLILLGGIGAVVVMNLGPKEKVKIEVQTEPARTEAITQVVTASGKIRPETEVKVAADVGGYIRKLTVKEGDRVEKGQLLVEIDPETYQAQVMESRAAAQTAQARLTLAEASLEQSRGEERRVRGLRAKDLISQANQEKAQADLAIAQAEVEAARGQLLQAQANLDRARKALAKCTINAPIAGTVTVLNKEQGERASGGDFREDIIMNVSDLSSMEVEVEVGERDIVLIQNNDPVEIEVDAYPGETISGYVKEVANAGITRNEWTESEVTNFRVVIQVKQSDKPLKPQMSATVRIQTDFKEQTLTVPIQSVTLRRPSELAATPPEGLAGADLGREGRGPSGPHARIGEQSGPDAGSDKAGTQREEPTEVVFVVLEAQVQARQVKTGLSSDTRIEILSGLEAGDQVVSGPYRALSKDLQDGDAVRLTKASGPDGRPSRPNRNAKARSSGGGRGGGRGGGPH